MKEYTRKHFADWDEAVKLSEQRNQAIEEWKNKKNIELHGIRDQKRMGEIENKFDMLFAAILKKYPVKTIHDFTAIDRAAGVEGYSNGKSMDGWIASNNRHQENRDNKRKIQTVWAEGSYATRDDCAFDEWEKLGFKSDRTARNALKNTLDPNPWPEKKTISGK